MNAKPSRRIIIIILLLLLVAAFAATLYFFLQPPRILALTPRSARAGDVIVVDGRGLGSISPRNSLLVGDQRITASYILEWEPDRISFRMPEGMRSGDLRVILPQGESNPMLLTNTDTIPRRIASQNTKRYDISPVPSSDDSLWRVDFEGYSSREIRDLGFFLDGEPLPESWLIRSEDHVLVYYPVISLTGSYDVPADVDDLLEDFESRLGIAEAENENKRIEMFRSARRTSSEIISADLPAGNEPLFSWRISIGSRSAMGPNAPQELRLFIPRAELENAALEVHSQLAGLVSVLPAAERSLSGVRVLRFFPNDPESRRSAGSVFIHQYGEPRLPEDLSLALGEARDNYDGAAPLFPFYEEYLEPADDFLLSPEQRDLLRSEFIGVRGALPLARSMYYWFIDSEISPSRQIPAFVDELRRLGIAARERRGFAMESERRFSATSWAEFFIPRWGWIPVYRESIEQKVDFGVSLYPYVYLPEGNEFPRLTDGRGGEIPFEIRLLPRRPAGGN